MSVRRMTRFVPALILGALAALSCTRDTVAPTAAPLADAHGSWGQTRGEGGLYYCRPLPHFADTVVVGPAGGVVTVGPHKLVIPPGALEEPVQIIGDAPRDTVRRVQFFPEGLEFEVPALLQMSYAGCQTLPGERPHRIAYTDDALHILYYVPSRDRPAVRRVIGAIGHFSQYAVGW